MSSRMDIPRPLRIPVLFLLVTFCRSVLCSSNENKSDGPLTENDFPYLDKLDDNFSIKWKFNSSHILFHIKAKTKGYVGFGISENGNMYPGDMVIAWMSGETVHFHDRHATSNDMPKIDKQQDWHILGFRREDNQYNVLTVIRKLNTCDDDDDIPITTGTTRIIYAYSDSVPDSDESIPYHGAYSRGTKSLLLLHPPPKDHDVNSMPDDVITVDIVHENFTVPDTDTTYACKLVKFPRHLEQKHHIIRYEPVVQTGHEKLVHHIVLYFCRKPVPDGYLHTPFHCYENNPEDQEENCDMTMLAWAIGNSGFHYPPHVGHSMGTADDPVYFKIEIHYDNPTMRSDYVDNSGLRLFLTKKIREHDAGMLTVGTSVDGYHIIPPHYSDFLTTAYCPPQCISQAIGDNEIKIFSSLQHSHLLGRRMATRLVRDGVELPPIVKDDHYDFNYQESFLLPEERVVKKGDLLFTECHYDSTERTNITYGGLSTQEEMCMAFILYYPRTKLSQCFSQVVYRNQHRNALLPDVRLKYVDWSLESNRKHFAENVTKSIASYYCVYRDNENPLVLILPQPSEFKQYIPEDVCNTDNGDYASDNNGGASLLTMSKAALFTLIISFVMWKCVQH